MREGENGGAGGKRKNIDHLIDYDESLVLP